MPYMTWDDSYSVGVEEIDEQHKTLIGMINDFYEGIKENQTKALGELLDSLIRYTLYHFSTEEKYMELYWYADTEAHKKEHQMFAEKAMDVKRRFDEGGYVLSLEVTNFLKEWIINHVLRSDKKYSQCFAEHGLR